MAHKGKENDAPSPEPQSKCTDSKDKKLKMNTMHEAKYRFHNRTWKHCCLIIIQEDLEVFSQDMGKMTI